MLGAIAAGVLPGYFWAGFLRPAGGLGERLAWSAALSLASVPVLALALARAFGTGVTLGVAIVSIAVVLGSGALALVLRGPPADRAAPALRGAAVLRGAAPLRGAPGALRSAPASRGAAAVRGAPGMPDIPVLPRPPAISDWRTLALIVAAFGVALAVALGLPSPWWLLVVMLAALVVAGALASAGTESGWQPSVVLREPVLAVVLALTAVRAYAGPVRHDWPYLRGSDLFSHAVMAEQMLAHGTYTTYLIYPPGFSTLTAVICRVSGLTPLALFPVLAPALLVLTTLAAYALATKVWGWEYGLAAAALSGLVLRGPYASFAEGRYPDLTAAYFLLVMLVAALITLYGSPSVRSGVLVAVVGGSVVLYHSVATLYLALLLAAVGVVGLPYLLLRQRRRTAGAHGQARAEVREEQHASVRGGQHPELREAHAEARDAGRAETRAAVSTDAREAGPADARQAGPADARQAGPAEARDAGHAEAREAGHAEARDAVPTGAPGAGHAEAREAAPAEAPEEQPADGRAETRRLAWSLTLALGGLGVLAVAYAGYTYLLGSSGAGTSGTSTAVSIAVGSQSVLSVTNVLSALSSAVVWLGVFGLAALVAGIRYLRRPGQVMTALTLVLWFGLMYAGSRTAADGFPQRFERDLGGPLSVLGALGAGLILQSLVRWRAPRRTVAVLAAVAAGAVVAIAGVQAIRATVAESHPVHTGILDPQVAAAGAWLGQHNTGGTIISTPAMNSGITNRAVLAMGGYTGLQSYSPFRIAHPRSLPTAGRAPLLDSQQVLTQPASCRSAGIFTSQDVRYVILYRFGHAADLAGFRTDPARYRRVFENPSVVIYAPSHAPDDKCHGAG
jgi:hypothetical protein